jgi:hypothetical protein
MEHNRENHATKRVTRLILFPLFIVLFLFVGGSSASAFKALFVVGGDSLSPGDKVIRNQLKTRGFEVVVKNDRNVTAASAAGKDLIVISESALSTRLKNKFRNVRVPVICLDAYQYDDLGMTARELSAGSKFGYIEEQQSVQIKDAANPLAARLPTGYVVEVGQRDITMSWGVPGKNALRVATLVNSTDKLAIFAYDKGKKMPGLVAPAKRIGFFLTSKGAKSLTADGWKLFNAAVNWAVELEEPEPCPDGNASITFVNNCGETIWVAQLGNGASKKCSSDADCGVNGQDGNCTNGACAQVLCEADSDCNSTIQFCNLSSCTSNSDCPAISCIVDTDCPFHSDPTVPQKCMAGGLCSSDNNCTAISCYSDGDCPFSGDPTNPQTCIGGGPCQSNSDCPAIACTTSAECPSGATCDTANKVCTPSCLDGQCLCNSASDCPGPYATCQDKRCSKAVGYCSPQCRPDGHCACETASSGGLPPPNACAGGQTCQNNLCSEPVGYCSAACRPNGQCACTTDTVPGLPAPLACPGVETCQDNLCSGVGVCTYKNLPLPGYWQLPHVGNNSKQICVPADNKESTLRAWGGRFWARTGCPENFATCKPQGAPCDNNTACCNNSCQGGVCQPGIPACLTGDCKNALECQVSGSVPVTLFEVNYAASKVAYYDVSLADSYNVPILATPKTAGCPAAGCTGNLNARCPQLLQPSGTPPSCKTNADCLAGGVCENGTCVIGCISACNQCRDGINVAALQCNQVVPDGDGVTKFVDLYCCTNNLSCNLGAPTCFDDIDCASIECKQNADCASDNCTARGVCGGMTCDQSTYLCNPVRPCPSDCTTHPGYTCDPISGACVPPTNCCGPYNPLWRKAMETYVSAFKEACPTAYSYQYDDPTSLFTCPNSGQGVNYTITFCPSP